MVHYCTKLVLSRVGVVGAYPICDTGWHFCIVTPQKLFPSPQVVRVFLTSFEFRGSLEVSTPDDCAVCSKQAFLVKRGGYSSELTASAIPGLEGSSSSLEHRTLDFGSVLASNTVLQP